MIAFSIETTTRLLQRRRSRQLSQQSSSLALTIGSDQLLRRSGTERGIIGQRNDWHLMTGTTSHGLTPQRAVALHPAATGTITVNLGQIVRNWQAIAARVDPAICAAVVKANAYGLGADRVIPALLRAGCTTFFIATPQEAEQARRLAPKATIYGLNGLIGGSATETFVRLDIQPILSTLDDIFDWAAVSQRVGQPLACGLHIDTGLNRLGLTARAVRQLVSEPETLSKIAPTLVMSHLACADNPSDLKNRDQLLAFETLSALLPRVRRSLAASDGLMLGAKFCFDMVRPGYALYGGQASETFPAPVKPTVTVTARILAVADVAAGETVGYSATWRAQRASRIATIAAGYADGIARSASSQSGNVGTPILTKGHVLISGHAAPIVGRVSMDLITVDVTDLPEGAASPGGSATLLGSGITLEQAGFAADTIGYEVLTRLGPRFARLYLDDTVA